MEEKGGIIKQGLVLGKFMPLHNGHIGLINFALSHCEKLVIMLCSHEKEPIPGNVRESWLNELFENNSAIRVFHYRYDPLLLTDSSNYSYQNTKPWADKVKELFPDIEIIFSSEEYGKYLAEIAGMQHREFDSTRLMFPVSATVIRNQPFKYWHYLAGVARPWFVKKVAICGSESTGKSVLAQKLAAFYHTDFVPEMARDVIGHTNDCTYDDLQRIAAVQAQEVRARVKKANKILFCDTELQITKSYSGFLFDRELEVADWIEEVNHFDLYIFLEADCEFVQDGTRLDEIARKELSEHHRAQLTRAGINYVSISGNWDERFSLAVSAVEKMIQ